MTAIKHLFHALTYSPHSFPGCSRHGLKGHPDTEADLVVLATGIVPRKDNLDLARVLNINQSADGFFLEAHPKLRPVDTFTDGIFLAGCCQGPKDMQDTVSMASGAAARAANILSKKELETEPQVACVDEEACSGCSVCISVCAYNAIEIDTNRRIAVVNDALCKGCGACAATCRSSAIDLRGFRNEQILCALNAL